MPHIEPDREYKFLDPKALAEAELKPVDGDAVWVLEQALLDIIQLSQAEGMLDEEVDDVLSKLVDDRANRLRDKFRLRTGD